MVTSPSRPLCPLCHCSGSAKSRVCYELAGLKLVCVLEPVDALIMLESRAQRLLNGTLDSIRLSVAFQSYNLFCLGWVSDAETPLLCIINP